MSKKNKKLPTDDEILHQIRVFSFNMKSFLQLRDKRIAKYGDKIKLNWEEDTEPPISSESDNS